MKRYFCIIIILAVTFCTFAQKITLPAFLSHSNVSLVVTDVATNKNVLEYEPQRCATPASITKLVTTATALEILSPDFKFTTKVMYDGKLRNGIVEGNLYIVGGGDPSLGSRFVGDTNFIDIWCKKMQDAGITRIAGNLVVDATVYDREAVPTRWIWEDMGNYYGAGAYGLSVFDNTIKVTLRCGAVGTQPSIVSVWPQIADLQFYNFARTYASSQDSIYFYGLPYDNRRWIYGAAPANRANFVVKADIPNPAMCLAEYLKSRMVDFGIVVSGEVRETLSPANPSALLFEYESKPLSELVKVTNFYSNNNYAEHILKQLALQHDKVATNHVALQVERNFWASRGVDFSSVLLNDGSGLSPVDAFSADFLNQILLQMAKSPNFQTFLSSIPKAGQEGSVKTFLAQNKKAEVHAKSGSMAGVQSYAGYIIKGGKTYSFCVIVNNFDSRKEVRQQIEKWLMQVINK